ncbi:MAG: class I SAM-dependent methyltransferase [Planctomycetes bacterium]|nr:class I SAM-dependent methyltransferase [Planctomycetota bacterium]
MSEEFHEVEDRFEFGENWASFLATVDEERIKRAEDSLREFLAVDSLDGLTFLDVGSGSGLFSLAARRLGARVCSFDRDSESVATTKELKKRYCHGDPDWRVLQGSVLDAGFVDSLGTFDIVYSWGVLHHTGAMWDAINNAYGCIAEKGQLFISIYNMQGNLSYVWVRIKRTYNVVPEPVKTLMVYSIGIVMLLWLVVSALMRREIPHPFRYVSEYKRMRGMSWWHDIRDWVGGYPFEVARPCEIFGFLKGKGMSLENLKTCAGEHDCNQYLFRKI